MIVNCEAEDCIYYKNYQCSQDEITVSGSGECLDYDNDHGFQRNLIMTIELLRIPTDEDWQRCKMLAMNTIGKSFAGEVSPAWKLRILQAEHSPIRTLMFTVRMEIPYYVSVHFCRHKYGVEHFVTTQRNDRQSNYDRNAARQDATVIHIMDINAQALINLAHRRLCGNADPLTREVMRQITDKVCEAAPEMQPVMIPLCEYRGGVCHDFISCGRCEQVR